MTPLDQISEADLQALINNAPGKRPKFNARHQADELIAETPVARGGGDLYVYRNGTYQPGGREDLRERIAAKLGDGWRKNRSLEVVTLIEHTAPRLDERPHPNHVNLVNGILDVTDGDLQPHTPDYRSPVQLPVRYDRDATCPTIDRFLSDTLDPELRELVYEMAGYLATSDNSLQSAFMFLGAGANGKSTLLNLLTALLGSRNVSNIALDDDKFAAASLYGKLANVFADLDHRALQSSSVFKSVTGGDAITGERKHQDAFSFTPFTRLLFSANEPPPTSDHSDAFFRRWVVLPFERRFEGRDADRSLGDRLTTGRELSGLLNHGLERLPDLRDRGAFITTAATTAAAEQFRADSDSVAGFIGEQYEVRAGLRTRQSSLYPAYKDWCFDSNRRPLGKQRFNRRLLEVVPTATEAKDSSGTRYWDGLGIREEGEW
jgi:P4 family phage/plasmid primase-like protien